MITKDKRIFNFTSLNKVILLKMVQFRSEFILIFLLIRFSSGVVQECERATELFGDNRLVLKLDYRWDNLNRHKDNVVIIYMEDDVNF
jgi:hypothetical protein